MKMQTDYSLVIAIVGSAVAIIGVVIAMMFWARSEGNSLRQEMKDDRKDMLQITRNIENTMHAINNEIRDFHRQLLEIQRKVG